MTDAVAVALIAGVPIITGQVVAWLSTRRQAAANRRESSKEHAAVTAEHRANGALLDDISANVNGRMSELLRENKYLLDSNRALAAELRAQQTKAGE